MAFNWTIIDKNFAKKYIFVLDGEFGRHTLQNAPIEWKDIQLRFRRDDFYEGVFTECVVDSLTFVRDGRQILEGIYNVSGIFGWCDLEIYYLDFNTRTYKMLPTSFRVDFNTYELIKKAKTTTAVKISLLPNDDLAKILQRADTEVDLTKTTTIGGMPLDTGRDHWASMKKTFNFPEINSYYTAVWEQSTFQTWNQTINDTYFVYLPNILVSSDFDEVNSIPLYEGTTYDKNHAIFYESDQARNVRLTGTIIVDVEKIGGNAIVNVMLDIIDSSNVLQSSHTLASAIEGYNVIPFDVSDSLATGDSIIIYCWVNFLTASEVVIDITSTETNMSEIAISTPATTVESFPIYEAIERTLQHLMDKQFPFYSDFFGRDDVVWKDDGTLYAGGNQFRYANLLLGLMIRGMDLNDSRLQLPVKFKDLFKALKTLWNVGGGMEEIDGDQRFRIEHRMYYYADTEILDLSDRVYEIEIEREVLLDRAFMDLRSGFSKYDYFAINGRGEYNTPNNRTSQLPTDTKFDNVCPYRADTRGMTLLLEKPIAEYGTEDVRGDEDIFIVKSQRNGNEWDAETDENIQVVGNTSLFQDGSLNLYFTPTRNLLRHDFVVKAGLDKKPGTEFRFQYGGKLTTLITTDGVDNVVENGDIDVDSLNDPEWHPESMNIEISFYESDYEAIKANPRGYVTLSDGIRGWILELIWDMRPNKARIKLLTKWD